jgi:hypothetical protein
MSQLNWDTPSGKTGGIEGNKSSIVYSNLQHRQDLEKSYNRCLNELLQMIIAKGYDKLLQLNLQQFFKELVASQIRQNYLPITDEKVYRSILAAHTKAQRIIENLAAAKSQKLAQQVTTARIIYELE